MIVLPRSMTSPSVLPSRGTGVAGFGIADLELRERRHRHALARHLLRALGERQRGPLVLPRAQRRGAVRLGEPVEVRDAKAHRLHRLDHRRRRRRAAGGHVDACARTRTLTRRPARGSSRLSTIGAPHRCVTPLVADRREDQRRIDAAQAHVRGAGGGDRPRVRPAAAVEHRQRPQVDAVGREPERERVAERVEIRAAMVIDDALGIAGRARRVEQRERVPLVARARPRERGIAFREQILVAHAAEALARAGPRVSSMSTTSERVASSASAALITGANSASVMSDLRAAVRPGRTRSPRASRRTLSGLSTAPSAGTA